ncbi:hypothetical protein DERF_010083 [Dermatophagoides farinae]|uniref:Uncharacterized protein n=1 Tax=Dermatophagoides farinae TaxID=6954 RepID=A0A922HWF2_DERFA|nr:hypothetical protein DERF_010083 [Dermatophagoides farinae]
MAKYIDSKSTITTILTINNVPLTYSSSFLVIIIMIISTTIITIIPTYEMAIIPTQQQRQNRFKLVVFSFDGFRPDYIDIERTPNLYAVAKNGVQGEMRSTFVTKTYPNHQSIVTGLYEPYHGIINNLFIDNQETKQLFNVNNNSIYWWDQNNISVPIYIANQYYEPNRYSISIQWPGSISNYTDGFNFNHRERVYYLENYNANSDWFHFIDLLMKWLLDPINMHINLDRFSDEVYEQVKQLDKVVGYFRKQLLTNHLAHITNVIYLSDHGMAEIRSERSLYIDRCDEYYPGLKYELYGSSPVWSAIPISAPKSSISNNQKLSLAESVRDALNNCSHEYFNGKFTAYLQEDIADEFHYKNNIRILPLFIIADEGYDINYKDEGWRPKGYPIWGNHGYNASLPSMRPLFLAQGPRFKFQYRHPVPFENIDLYPLMLNLLDIPQKSFPRTNGTFERVHQMLSNRLYLNDNEFTMGLYDMFDHNADHNTWMLLFLYLMTGFLILFMAGFCFVCISGRLEKNYLRNSIDSSSTTRSRLTNYLRKISYGHHNNNQMSSYRMFANERPTSHLDSSDDDDSDDGGENELYNRHNHHSHQQQQQQQQQQQSQKSKINQKNQLTDIDWDILGTGLDIDLVGQLNQSSSSSLHITKRNEYLQDSSNDDDDDYIKSLETKTTSTMAKRNEAISLLISDADDDDDDENDEEIKAKINIKEYENLISESMNVNDDDDKKIDNKLIDI